MTCFIGVDLHKTQFTVHTRTENRVESMDQIIQYPVTNEGYANFLKRIRNLTTRGYEVKKICCVDMFPNTYHVETVVLMSKKN